MVHDADAHVIDDRCIHELFADQARQRPNAIALQFEDECVTYGELERRANQLAQRLLKMGVKRENYVSVLVERSAQLVTALLGILKAGGAYAPLDPKYPQARLAFMMKDTASPVVLTQSSLESKIPDGDAQILRMDDDWESIAREPPDAPPLDVGAENLAYVNYTSGSTGEPKGVEVLHRGVTRLVKNTSYADFSSEEIFLHFAPITFDAATFEVWGSLLNGAQLAIIPDQMPNLRELGHFIQSRGVTTLWLTAGLFHKMVEHNLEGLNGVRQLLTGGDVVSVRHAKEYLQQVDEGRLINGYGPTENTTFTTCYTMTAATQLGKTVPIGTPIANTTVYILDENLQPVSQGEAGELYTGGRGLARGYLNRPAHTREKFIHNPFSDASDGRLYKTGDLVRYLPDGNIEFLGRTDDQVKIRGFRIELDEIRTILNRHPAIEDAIVVAREERTGEKQLVAYVVPDFQLDARDRPPEDGETHVADWQLLYDQLYDPSEDASSVEFNIVGWESSYTGQPIPPEQMREWVDRTVMRIMSLNPRRVMEIGCGTGLLLFRVAPHCVDYLASDLSPVVIRNLKTKLERPQRSLPQVRLLAREADNFEGIETDAFDTIILNSVVQYFPSIDYLRAVLEQAVRCVSPGGSVFVGDVRSLPLLEAFHTAVQLHRASPETEPEVLKQRIRMQQMQEDELVISPAFFAAFTSELPKIGHVEVHPKQGRFQNEMTQFRYDVVLHLHKTPARRMQTAHIDWKDEQLTLAKLRGRLQNSHGTTISVRNIRNARTSRVAAAVELLKNPGGIATVGELKDRIYARQRDEGVSPEDICSLGSSFGYDVQLSWLNSRTDGAFDCAFCAKSQTPVLVDFPYPAAETRLPPATLATVPAEGKKARRLIPELQRFVIQNLPDYMVPSFFVAIDTLPLSPNGKIDRKALPPPDFEAGRLLEYEPPHDDLEHALVQIWQHALGVQPIGIRENFFDLGGSSLLAAEVFHEIGTQFKRDLPLAILAQNPTIYALAEVLRRETERTSWASLVPIQTKGTRPPLFCMHGGLGNVVGFRELSQLIGDEQPLYGLQWNGLDGSPGNRTIEEMAADYLARIRTVQPHGPYLLAGHCVGGITAYEMAQQLAAEGETVSLLIMFDTPNVKSKTYLRPSLWKSTKAHLRWLINECQYSSAIGCSLLTNRGLSKKWEQYRETRHFNPNALLYGIVLVYGCLGRRVPPNYRTAHALGSMLSAVRRYSPQPYAGRIAFFHAGTDEIRFATGFYGRFIDGMYGWAPAASENFEFHAISGCSHVTIVKSDKMVSILKTHLDEALEEIVRGK